MGSSRPVVVLSRSAADNQPLAQRLLAAGLQVSQLPTAAFADVALDWLSVEGQRAVLAALAFTSPHGVTAWRRAVRQLGQEWDMVPTAAVGDATAAALAAAGTPARWVASEAVTGAGLARLLASELAPGSHVGLPQARHARPELADGLREAGHVVHPFVVYENCAPQPQPADLEAAARADLVYAAAPSAAERLLDWLPGLARLPWVAIGPTTAGRLAELSPSTVVTVAPSPAIDDVARAIIAAARALDLTG